MLCHVFTKSTEATTSEITADLYSTAAIQTTAIHVLTINHNRGMWWKKIDEVELPAISYYNTTSISINNANTGAPLQAREQHYNIT